MAKKIDWSNARGGIPAGMIMIKGELVDAKKARRQAQVQNFGLDVQQAVKKGVGTAAKSVRNAVKNSNLSKTINKLKRK